MARMLLRLSATATALLLLGAVGGRSAALPPLTQQAPLSVNERQRLVDQYGRELLFHGANVVVKGFPWLPDRDVWSWDNSFVAKDMKAMQRLGLNAIRLGTMWPGAMPSKGVVNQTYLDELAGIVREASTYGIVSLMDMHQDAFSEKFCGEGVPVWAAETNVTNFPWPLQETPYNYSPTTGKPFPTSQCFDHGWTSYYPSQAVSEGFQNLYTNAFGMRDQWITFWTSVAATMKPLGAAVMGYELINEPWAGDIIRDILLMVPGVADKVNLQPTYEVLQQAIRLVDATHALFFEGVTWDWFNVGFTQVPGGDAWQNKSVLSYHYYQPPDFNVDIQFAARQADMKRLSCGGVLTEFGAPAVYAPGTGVATAVMEKCDEDLQSWLFWELKRFRHEKTGYDNALYFPNGSLDLKFAKNVSRTYAQAVAGVTRSMSFDYETAAFELLYTVSDAVTSNQTVIFASQEYHYPNGVEVSVLPQGAAAVTFNESLVLVEHTAPAGTTITVTISA